jgi:hypothetical protein
MKSVKIEHDVTQEWPTYSYVVSGAPDSHDNNILLVHLQTVSFYDWAVMQFGILYIGIL